MHITVCGLLVHTWSTQRDPSLAKQHECPISTSSSAYSQSDADVDDQELFSPAFHSLPDDRAHLHVHDAPAALAPVQSRRRGAHEGDENAEPPCVSTVSTCTTVANADEEECAMDGDLDDDDAVVFDPFAFIKNLPPLPDCVNSNRRMLLPRCGVDKGDY